jgi:hypothetical protein
MKISLEIKMQRWGEDRIPDQQLGARDYTKLATIVAGLHRFPINLEATAKTYEMDHTHARTHTNTHTHT